MCSAQNSSHSRLRVRQPKAYWQAVMPRDQPAGDEELMLAYRDGDASAFDELYRRHKAPLYRYVLRQCRQKAVAEELFQDVWTNLIRARSTYTVTARFTTYLYRLAHNRLIDHYRRRLPDALVSFESEDETVDGISSSVALRPDHIYEAREQLSRVLQLVEALPAAQREAFVLQVEAGLSVEDIATVTGVTRETAKSRLRYAMAKLREGMHGWL
jgi:RNA polymerase sigma factor (sigma-70 family)